jgi:hypothetical protein
MRRLKVLMLTLAATIVGGSALAASANAAPFHFVNAESILVAGDAPANPPDYPSEIPVTGISGTVAKATVTLSGFSGDADDLYALLVGPRGQNVLLMGYACQTDINSGISVTFDDAAPSLLQAENCNSTGSFKPSNYDGSPEAMTAPAPGLPYGSLMSAFNGTDPNGEWRLFLENIGGLDQFGLEAGWSLDLDVTPPPPVVQKKKCPKGKKLKKVKTKKGKKKKKCVKKKKKKGKK